MEELEFEDQERRGGKGEDAAGDGMFAFSAARQGREGREGRRLALCRDACEPWQALMWPW